MFYVGFHLLNDNLQMFCSLFIVSLCQFIEFYSMVCNHRESGGSASGGQRDEPKGAVKINRHKNRAPPLQVLPLHSLSLSPARFLKFHFINSLQIYLCQRFVKRFQNPFSFVALNRRLFGGVITSSHSYYSYDFQSSCFPTGRLVLTEHLQIVFIANCFQIISVFSQSYCKTKTARNLISFGQSDSHAVCIADAASLQ